MFKKFVPLKTIKSYCKSIYTLFVSLSISTWYIENKPTSVRLEQLNRKYVLILNIWLKSWTLCSRQKKTTHDLFQMAIFSPVTEIAFYLMFYSTVSPFDFL